MSIGLILKHIPVVLIEVFRPVSVGEEAHVELILRRVQ